MKSMRWTTALGILLLAACAAPRPATAGDWPNWRGPNHNGSSSETGLPVDFSKSQNIKWSVDLPGPSGATPIIVADRVFVSSVDLKSKKLVALCFDRKTGKKLWEDVADSGYRVRGSKSQLQLDNRSNYASPSPVSDGKRVVFFYGNGDLVGYTVEGKKLWTKNLQQMYGDFAFQWTFSSSPTLHQGKLYMQVLQRDQPAHKRGKKGAESYLLQMDPDSGEVLIKHVRPSKAKMESLESFGTPIPHVHEGREELIIAGGDVLTGHDPKTLKELWRWGTWNPGHREKWWRLVPSAVTGGGVVLACAPKKQPVYAIKLGLSGTHEGDDGLVWKSKGISDRISSDVPTPAFSRGKFYVLSDVGSAISQVDPASGKIDWTTRLSRNYKWRSSPTVADGKIYLMNHHGEVVIVNQADGKILQSVLMGGKDADLIRSTIAVAGKNLFIRTNIKLFCVGK
ncbi:MAG: PQQ-binding-like beta-propeller repeat protein [Phycisphaeraceae bacterium]|nr:PQQ-binding-like beta-propeller repeat protein [Phycisphaeraceae bacterium]